MTLAQIFGRAALMGFFTLLTCRSGRGCQCADNEEEGSDAEEIDWGAGHSIDSFTMGRGFDGASGSPRIDASPRRDAGDGAGEEEVVYQNGKPLFFIEGASQCYVVPRAPEYGNEIAFAICGGGGCYWLGPPIAQGENFLRFQYGKNLTATIRNGVLSPSCREIHTKHCIDAGHKDCE